MRRRENSPLPDAYLRQIARLMELHKALHPTRIAQRYGVTDEYVRQQWVRWHEHEMAPLDEALEVFFAAESKDQSRAA